MQAGGWDWQDRAGRPPEITHKGEAMQKLGQLVTAENANAFLHEDARIKTSAEQAHDAIRNAIGHLMLVQHNPLCGEPSQEGAWTRVVELVWALENVRWELGEAIARADEVHGEEAVRESTIGHALLIPSTAGEG